MRLWILSSPVDTILSMPDARDLTTDEDVEPADLAWLDARLEEYRELLEYLREH